MYERDLYGVAGLRWLTGLEALLDGLSREDMGQSNSKVGPPVVKVQGRPNFTSSESPRGNLI
jgi:hypothetical protein